MNITLINETRYPDATLRPILSRVGAHVADAVDLNAVTVAIVYARYRPLGTSFGSCDVDSHGVRVDGVANHVQLLVPRGTLSARDLAVCWLWAALRLRGVDPLDVPTDVGALEADAVTDFVEHELIREPPLSSEDLKLPRFRRRVAELAVLEDKDKELSRREAELLSELKRIHDERRALNVKIVDERAHGIVVLPSEAQTGAE